MSDRFTKNLTFTVLGAAYILGGVTVTHVSPYIAGALIVIGIYLVVRVVRDLVTPPNAADLHFKP